MASHIIIGDSDDDSENDIGKQERSIESLGGLVKAGAVSEPRQRDSLHDSTDSTELLNRDIRDAHRALMEQTPNWKMPEPSMSTSSSNTQQRSQDVEPSLKSVGKRSKQHESNTQTSKNSIDDIHGQKNSEKTSSADQSKKVRRSNPRSEPKDLWEFPGSSASTHEPTAETEDVRPKRIGSRATAKEGTSSKTDTKKTKRRGTVADTNEEDEDVWEPACGSKILEEPCNPRTTRRQGSASLVDGLKKRKRQKGATEMDSGSATEASLVSKRVKKDGHSRQRGPLSGSSFLVDLAKSDNILSDSQKQQYEYISVESSIECPPLLPFNSEHSFVDSLANELDLTGDGSNTNLALARDTTGPEESIIVAEVAPHRTSTRDMMETNVDTSRASPRLVIQLHSSAPETSIKETERVPSNPRVTDFVGLEDSSHLEGESVHETQSTSGRKKHTIVMNESKSKKAKKTSSRRGPSNQLPVVEEDASEADKIGLPPERYKPRPSRSRAKQNVDETDGNDVLDMNMDNVDNAHEEKAPVPTPSPPKSRKKSRRKQSTVTEPMPPSRGQQLKAEDDSVQHLDEPLHEVDNNEVRSKRSPNPESVAPTTPGGYELQPKSPKPDDSTTDNATANDTAATSLPSPRSPEKPKTATKQPHSPLSSGRVPYRVGLSKKVKIQPLLRIMKR